MENIGKAKAEKFSTAAVIPAKPRLLDQVRQAIRSKHYSIRTQEAYVGWIKRFSQFHRKTRSPAFSQPMEERVERCGIRVIGVNLL